MRIRKFLIKETSNKEKQMLYGVDCVCSQRLSDYPRTPFFWVDPAPHLAMYISPANRVPLRDKPTVSPTVVHVGLLQLYSLAVNLLFNGLGLHSDCGIYVVAEVLTPLHFINISDWWSETGGLTLERYNREPQVSQGILGFFGFLQSKTRQSDNPRQPTLKKPSKNGKWRAINCFLVRSIVMHSL